MKRLMPNDLPHDFWGEGRIHPTQDHAIIASLIDKTWVNLPCCCCLGRTWFQSFYVFFESICIYHIFHLIVPKNVLILVQIDEEWMIQHLHCFELCWMSMEG